jgi:hypothetical protein
MTTQTSNKAKPNYKFSYAFIPGFILGVSVFQNKKTRNCVELNLGFVRLLWIANAPTKRRTVTAVA